MPEAHSNNSIQSTSIVNMKSTSIPPPPPLPFGLLNGNIPQKTNEPSTSNASDLSKSDCRGISAEALCNVRLKPVGNASTSKAPILSAPIVIENAAPKVPNGKKPPLDFDSDLRSALAKRRSKVCSDDDPVETTPINRPKNNENATG